MARPKSLHPPTVTAVRITKETKNKLDEEHRRWNSKEPYDRTLYRALSELEETRKKAKGLALENEALSAEVRTSHLAFDRLFNVHRENKKIFEMFGINPAFIEVPNK